MGYVLVLEGLLCLRFNLQLGTMYVEHEMFAESGVVFEIVIMQKTISASGSCWLLGIGSFRAIGLYDV